MSFVGEATAAGLSEAGAEVGARPRRSSGPSEISGSFVRVEVEGRRVFQAKDLFDTTKQSTWQDPVTGQWKRGTNLERMADGLAPIGSDGKSVALHHLLQAEPGALAEVPSSLHSRLAHRLKEPGKSFRNNPVLKQQFENFRARYWQLRSKVLGGGQ